MPVGTPVSRATSATGRPTRWWRTIATRWGVGMRASAATRATASAFGPGDGGWWAVAAVGEEGGAGAAPAADRYASGYCAYPCFGVAVLADGRPPLPRPREGLLHRGLRLGRVAGDRVQAVEEALAALGVERIEAVAFRHGRLPKLLRVEGCGVRT